MPDTRLEWVNQDGVPKLVEKAPTQNAGPIPPADVIAQQQDKQKLKMLQQEFGKAGAAVKQEMEDAKMSIRSNFKFTSGDLKRQYDAEQDPGRKQALFSRNETLVSQTMAKLAAVDNKFAPTNREMKSAYDAEVGKLQQAAQKRDFELQVLRKNAGNFKSDALVRQAEYKAMGIDVPLSQLEVEAKPDPKEIKATLIRDIGNIDKMLERYTPGKVTGWNDWSFDRKAKYVDPTTGEERKLNPKKPEDKAIIDDMTNLTRQQGELRKALHANMLAEDPAYGQIFRDQEDRQKAAKDYLDPGAKGGSIEESITNTIAKQNKGKRIRVQSPDGQTGTVTEKELASYMAQGYKRI